MYVNFFARGSTPHFWFFFGYSGPRGPRPSSDSSAKEWHQTEPLAAGERGSKWGRSAVPPTLRQKVPVFAKKHPLKEILKTKEMSLSCKCVRLFVAITKLERLDKS